MLALLRTRRWLSFSVLVVALIIAFGLLSWWQWTRAQDKQRERIALESSASLVPQAVADALVEGMSPSLEWQRVKVTGQWQPADQVLVRRRPMNSTNGFWVMTPLVTPAGGTAWVNRGWLAAQESASSIITAPAPSTGTVTVIGFLRSYESSTGQDDLPSGQVSAASIDELPAQADPLSAYIQLADPPQSGLVTVSMPDVDENRNLSYAGQWLLFALVAIGGWFFFLRREARDDADRRVTQEGS